MPIAALNRSVLRLSGEGVTAWLDGLITNSLSNPLTFAALLTPQGKIIADFFVTQEGDDLLIDTPTKFAADLFKRLRMYKLRAPIEITDITATHNVYAIWDGEGEEGHADPRHVTLGRRLITEDYLDGTDDYGAHRLSLGVVDSEYDFETVTTFPADANMDLMNGVDFKKGCFVGQEVVSRMKRMTTVKKRMRTVELSGPAKVGDKIMAGERVIGDIYHVNGNLAMGLVRLDRMKAAEIEPTVNENEVRILVVLMVQSDVEIHRNDESALPRFAALNAEWIEELHVLEESDKMMIVHPEIYIQNGSHVFSAHIDGEVAGACALKKHEDGRYELTKMAVDTKFRGKGIGQHLMSAMETYAKDELGLDYLFLLSNTKNAAALRLYARNGWTVNHEGPHPIYARANIGMEKHL